MIPADIPTIPHVVILSKNDVQYTLTVDYMSIFNIGGIISALKQQGMNIKVKHKSNKKDKKVIEDRDPLVADMVESRAKKLAGNDFYSGAY